VKKKILYILIALFVIFLISFFIIQEKYISESQTYYTNAIKKEIQILIKTKQKATFDIAKNISIDKDLIQLMKNNNYNILYNNPHFFPIYDDYKSFKHIGVHIIDKDGVQKYLSWTKKSLGDNVLGARPDLAKILKNPHPTSNISSGLFDITFKGIVPVFDNQKHFLGLIEVITHFNSIIKQLQTQNIYSAVILTKEKSKKIKYNKFGTFINGYFISNKELSPKIKPYLEKDIKKYISININTFNYEPKEDDLFDGYFVVTIPIINNGKTIAYFVAFIEDTFKLKEKQAFLNIIMTIITILFIIMGYIAYKSAKENEKLITFLHDEVKRQMQKQMQMYYNDALTGAYKKSKFETDKDDYIGYYVIMLNIKNFSKINELYGFKTGDEVLKITAKRLQRAINSKLYRINADEFVFFSKQYKRDIAKIKKLFIENPIKLRDNLNLRLSFSFAVTKNSGKEILRQLSIALKEAKTKPFRNFIYFKQKEINKDFIKFNSLLYDAIFNHEEAEIVPYFQGVVDNKTKKIIKYESLARLKTKDKVYTPFFFIEIAKSSGFLFEITKIMIDKSFAKIANTDINLSINITEDDLLTFQLKPYLIKKLSEYNLKAEQITLEILEGITSSGTKNNIKQLKELKSIGFKLAIDDFGVEYSNFERINELDVDYIKIDGKYIKNLPINRKSYEITKAITHFAHSLGIEIIAEFVEDETIQKIIEELAIEYSQGYYFDKPKEDI